MNAQDDNEDVENHGLEVYVFASPLKMLDLSNSGLLYGAGIQLPFGTSVELGHLYLLTALPYSVAVTDNRGNRFHLSLRKHLHRLSRTSPRAYLQVRGDLLNRKHQSIISMLPELDTSNYFPEIYQDSITVLSRITTINLMVGVELPIGKHFFIDLSAGLGSRWRFIRHEDRINPEADYNSLHRDTEDWFNRDAPERSGGYFNIPFDARVLYIF